jgi:solute carrier family 13 (sodium-dependent dicarboxylate transporter), member 2/3/5
MWPRVVILSGPVIAGTCINGLSAIFGFAVVVWITEALDYAVSAAVIAALMAILLAVSPNVLGGPARQR